MKKFLLGIGLLWAVGPLAGREGNIPRKMFRDSLPVMTERCAAVLRAAYMEQTFVGEDRRIEGWEGYPVRLYEYRTGYDSTVGGPKKARVYLLDPSPRKLASWILTACWEVKGCLDYRYTEKMRRAVLHQSGGQFPVGGIVYEAMYRAGDYVPYLFRDGVTVWPADSMLRLGRGHIDDERLDRCLLFGRSELQARTGRFARIIGTTPEEYVACGGTEPVVGSDARPTRRWLDVVRDLYKKAWRSDRNELMVIWARCNL